MQRPSTIDVWCDGGPWDGLMIEVKVEHNIVFVPGHKDYGEEMVEVEHIYERFGNIAIYDRWTYK